MEYENIFKLFINEQSGFCSGHSSSCALLTESYDLHAPCDQGKISS